MDGGNGEIGGADVDNKGGWFTCGETERTQSMTCASDGFQR